MNRLHELLRRRRGETRGFTLIELLMVVTILGILSALLTQNLRMAKHRAKVGKALTEMHVIQSALESYYLDHGKFPPDVDGFIPFILTDSLSSPIRYLHDNRAFRDPLNEFRPNPSQWRFQTYRYINIAGHLEGGEALNSHRKPSAWLPVQKWMWAEAREKYGHYLIAATQIKYKDNFKRDEAGRSKAMQKWNEFYWDAEDGVPAFLYPDKDPMVSPKLVWAGLEAGKEDGDESLPTD
ncbi:MAG: type II secretion system protein [bacterium]|nr:type II secretion system protein [bacterium]